MEKILDFNVPVDVAAFDNVVAQLSQGSPADIMRAQEILSEFKKNPEAFFRVDTLLTESRQTATRFFALQILEDTIMHRWNSLEDENQKAIRGFIMNLIVKECLSSQHIRSNKALLTKMNTTLVAIAKREWPVRWPNFIQDVCQSAGPSDPMVENNLNILRLVGEEIFQFGSKTLTSRWVAHKKVSLASNFPYIMEICGQVLLNSEDTELLKVALETLEAYAPWMEPGLVMQEPILVRIAAFVVGDENVRTAAVRCFTEICGIKTDAGAKGSAQVQLTLHAFRATLQHITSALPTSHSSLMERVVQLYEHGNEVDKRFVNNLNQLLVTFLKSYYSHITHDDLLIVACHSLLVGMSNIDEKELFKSCVEYWWWLGDLLVRSPASSMKTNLMRKLPRILSDVRYVLIKRMAKPEEIVIVEEDGELRREHMADVEELEMYLLMREALVFLTHLDPQDTHNIMVNLMRRQLDRSEWSWHNCNTLSWAVGAISMAMSEEDESELFTVIVKGLLQLCKEMSGKENRAVIASNVMFVVGQYPRFLRRRVSFLFTVVRKIFEFMQEPFPGVQDMAVDTFLKLAKQLASSFVIANNGPSFAEEIANQWTAITSLLSPQQIQVCFSAIGCMVAADHVDHRSELLGRFLQDINESFSIFCENAAQSQNRFCTDSTLMVELLHYLRIFSSTADTAADGFIHEMGVILHRLDYIYRVISECQNQAVALQGPAAASTQEYKYLRLAKREILLIFERFVTHSEQLDFVAANCMPQVFSVVLVDYQNSIPQAKEAGALALAAACVQTFGERLSGNCGLILDHTFSTTVAMISDNMESYPEFRVNLFKLLKALNEKCFPAYVSYAAEHADVLEGMLWAIKHKDYPTMSTGLTALDKFLENVVNSIFAEAFYTAFIQRILEEVLNAALDLFHTAGFPYHCTILQKLFAVSASVPPETPTLGRLALTTFLVETLGVIPTLTPTSITTFTDGCYQAYNDAEKFKTLFADFLIEVQVWGAEQENMMQTQEERRVREEVIPGFSTMSTEEMRNPFVSARGVQRS